MKYDYSRETVDVQCTDTGVTVEGILLDEQRDRIRVDVAGAMLTFHRIKPGVYVCNNAGMEFVVKL
jgi:hypothetical protein